MQLHVVKGAWNEALGALELVRSASVSDPRSASTHGEESLASSHAIGHSAARDPGQFSSSCRLTSSMRCERPYSKKDYSVFTRRKMISKNKAALTAMCD